jgi:hypothetical protein
MCRWFCKYRLALALLSGLALNPVFSSAARAEDASCCEAPCWRDRLFPWRLFKKPCPPTVQPAPETKPETPTEPRPPQPQPPRPTEPTESPELSAAVGSSLTAFAPNMIGHLLMGSQSVNFRYNRAAGPINVANNGSTTLVNPSVADDNSPIPLDRIGFRFNYFDNAQRVTGFGPAVFNAQGVGTSFAQTREYSVERYTFNFEKTFLDGWGSVELRAPFSTGLASNLNLSAGTVAGPTSGGVFPVTATPGQTLGSDGTEFDNMTLIFKGLVYRTCPMAISAGLGLGIPTGADTNVAIVDYSGGTTQGLASVQRVRDIHIDNETWSLSPFVAALYTPNSRFFAQGFAQVDVPLNDSTINYSETITRGTIPPVAALGGVGLLRFPSLDPPFSVHRDISEQTLLQLDLGAGYWLFRDRTCSWITGIAPSLELHYTSTLSNASIVTLPADSLLQIDPNNPRRLTQEQPPRVGNLNNRLDILDMTVATTFELGERATLATGVSFPLKGSSDRTFDWEFHLQFNYYFGAKGTRRAPNY